ncbi:hypothetical protein [Sphingomonas sp. VNH70]|uniref:hypothetical protein n=1 Tax=Sphingomonas silueang TaxID=3156617 RepID=UPI0032B46C5F
MAAARSMGGDRRAGFGLRQRSFGRIKCGMGPLHYLPLAAVVISTISLGVSALAFRYARMKHLAAYPYVEARRGNREVKHAVHWSLLGPEAADWSVVKVSGGRFYQVRTTLDGHGGEVHKPDTAAPLAAKLLRPDSPIMTERHDKPMTIRFHLRSKANAAIQVVREVQVPARP